MKHPDITLVIAQYLRRIPDLERLLGRVKASVGSSPALLLPVVGEKILKQQVCSIYLLLTVVFCVFYIFPHPGTKKCVLLFL